METNLLVTSKPSTPSFEGKLSWKTKRLANKLGIKETYQKIADQTHKKTVFYLKEAEECYILSANNKKLCIPNVEIGRVPIADGIEALKKFIADINPRNVDKRLIRKDIKEMLHDAHYAYSSGEFRPILNQAKKNMQVQKETGIEFKPPKAGIKFKPLSEKLHAIRDKYVKKTNERWAKETPRSPYSI